MADPTTGEIESEEEALKSGIGEPALWLKHIKRSQKDEEAWRKMAKLATEIYEAEVESKTTDKPAFNILHANIETTVPALYNSTPIPDVRRRFGDADPVAKQSVDVLERALSYVMDDSDFDGAVGEGVRDSELAGRGFVRIKYEPEITDEETETGETYQGVGEQDLEAEHVIWDKWGHGPARCWDEVPWIYFEHNFTADDLENIGVSPERIKALTFDDQRDKDSDDEEASSGIFKTVKGYEVWHKKKKAVLFVAEQDKDKFLAVKPDPLGLDDFFPGVPLQPLRKRRDLTPICPYQVYAPLISELDIITRRIKSLIGQCKVRGLVDSRLKAQLELLRDCDDGQYEAADDATQFATGGGGLEKSIAHWPLAEIITVLKELYVQREQIKQTIYEVTGLSDVLRGATDPRETLGAQQLKAQSGSQRLSQRQNKVAKFCRDLIRIKAEIICRHFTTQNLSLMTKIQVTPEVEQILRNEMLRSYRIDIETDSTIRADIARSQEQMSNFLQGTAQYASAMAPVLQLAPGATAPIVEIYAAFARNFKLGKSAEDALDKLSQAAAQPQPEKPDPEQQKMELQQQAAQQQAQLDQQKGEREMAKMQADLQIKREMAAVDKEMKLLDLDIAREKAAMDMQAKQQEIAFKREALQMDQEAKVYDIQTKREMGAIDIETRRQKQEQSKVDAAE